MELTTQEYDKVSFYELFMMSKIQNLNGTHNYYLYINKFR